MESLLSSTARDQLDRFCRQYLQVHQEVNYPDEERLRNDIVQQLIYARLFNPDVVKHSPPQRYQLRILKELIKRIEQSIQDWEEEVSAFFSGKAVQTTYLPEFFLTFIVCREYQMILWTTSQLCFLHQ